MNAWDQLKSELKAMGREAIKDVRATAHETFFGKHEHASEIGTPLNPPSYEVTAERGNVHGGLAEKIDERADNSRPRQQEMER